MICTSSWPITSVSFVTVLRATHQWHFADSPFPSSSLIIPSSVSVAFLDRYSLSAKETLCDELWDRLRDGFFGTETGKAINAVHLLQGGSHHHNSFATVN